jgi:hypothetical protein
MTWVSAWVPSFKRSAMPNTASPGRRSLMPAPTAAIVPEKSRPRMRGSFKAPYWFIEPSRIFRSAGFTLAA